jgi:hypothetical protein
MEHPQHKVKYQVGKRAHYMGLNLDCLILHAQLIFKKFIWVSITMGWVGLGRFFVIKILKNQYLQRL